MSWLRRRLGVHLLRVLAMPHVGAAPAPAAHGLRYAMLTEAEALTWAADAELELDAARVRGAYARGDLCIGVRDGDTPAGYLWYAYSPTPHLGGVWVECGPRARYSYKAFVRPSHRGRGIAPELYRQAHAVCPAREREASLLAIDLGNKPSLRASLRAGRRVVGYAGFVLWGGRVLITFRSPGAKRVGFRFLALKDPQDEGAGVSTGGLARNCQSL